MTRISLIVLGVLALTAFSATQDTVTGFVTWLCTSEVAQDPQIKQALKIEIGNATRGDVERLLGKPWRTNNVADCEAEQYGEVWEYLVDEANGTFFRVHVAFNDKGKVSLVAKIPQKGKPVVLGYLVDKAHQH